MDRKASAVVAADELVGGWDVLGFEGDGVPLDGRAGFEGDDTQQDGFGETAGVVEVGHCLLGVTGLDGVYPFGEVAGEAREGWFGFFHILEFVFRKQDVFGAVVVLGEERALFTDQEQSAFGNLEALQVFLVDFLVVREFFTAVEPGQGEWATAVARTEVGANDRPERVAFAIDDAGGVDDLDRLGVEELEAPCRRC